MEKEITQETYTVGWWYNNFFKPNNIFLFISFNQSLLKNEIIFNDYKNLILFFITSFFIFSLGILDDKFNISASKKFFILSVVIIFILFFDNSLNIDIVKFSFWKKNFIHHTTL